MRRRQFVGLLAASAAGYAFRVSRASLEQPARDVVDVQWLARLPKVELHIHLEGALPKTAVWELLKKYGGDPSVRTREDLDRRFVYQDFAQFLRTWTWMTGYLREYDDYTLIGREVARDLARQNIRYVEGFFSPPDYRRSSLDPQRAAEALRAGLRQVTSIEVALVPDLVRDRGVEHARQLLERMAEVRRQAGIIGIGIGGFEPAFPPELFEGVYQRARELNLLTTAHAGEAAGPQSVWGAIRSLHVNRIGHATRAAEDPELLRQLAKQRIPLELCPISNVRTGAIRSAADHPLRKYFDLGIPVSLNSDDPTLFGNSLVDEFASAQRTHGFSRDEVRRLILSSIESTWLTRERKARLAETFRRAPGWSDTGRGRA